MFKKKTKERKQKQNWQKQNNAEINWNTEYKSEATSTVKMIAKIISR